MNEWLPIYLNDQLAFGVGFRELARRAASQNEDNEVGEALREVAAGIAEDVETYKRMMKTLGVRINPLKPVAAMVGERLGRLKLNGRVRSYSPLSRFVELDALAMAIANKPVLYENLARYAGLQGAAGVDFDEMTRRAQAQFKRVDEVRRKVAAEVLAD